MIGKSIHASLALALITLGTLILVPREAKAGDPGSQNGDVQNAFQYCLQETGDTAYYRSKPQNCKCPTRAKCNTSTAGTVTAGSTSNLRRPGSPPSAREAESRRVPSFLLSIAILMLGIGVVGLSTQRWLNMFCGRRVEIKFRRAGLTVACLLFAVALTSAVLVSTRSTSASTAPRSRSHLLQHSGSRAFTNSAEPAFSSAFKIGGPGFVEVGGTAIDKHGNTYIAGGFNGEVTFNTQPQPTTLSSSESYDVFVAKYDSAGQPLWARMANGATGLTFTDPNTNAAENFSFDGALAIAVDGTGNAYIGGGFVKSLTFKNAGGQTVASLTDDNSDINFELFVAKYDANGSLVWARGGLSGGQDNQENEEDLDAAINGITDIVVDKAGHPFVAGTFSGNKFLGHPVTNVGGRDVVLARLDAANGDPVWVSMPGSTGTDAAMGMGIDGNANLYLIGDMGGTITFPTEPNPTSLVLDDQFGDTFVAKYDQNGEALWAKQIGGNQPIDGEHIAVSRAGDLYLTGAFEGTAEFDSITVNDLSGGNGSSGFLARYTTNGSAIWVRPFGHFSGENPDGEVRGYRVAVDGAGQPYVSGVFEGEATFGIEAPATARTLTSGEAEDKFIAHYDSAGNFVWVKQPDESGSEGQSGFASKDTPIEILPMRLLYNQAANAMVLTGSFDGQLVLDNLTLVSDSGREGFVASLPLDMSAAAGSAIQFSADDYPVGEGAAQIQVTVIRSGDASNPATVDYTTADGTALQKSDYQMALGTLRFAPGETSKTFQVHVMDDGFAEGTEKLNLSLSNPTGGFLDVQSSATITIIDNDQATSANPIDGTAFFVRQQYLDFLGREPDAPGFQFWQNEIASCGTDAPCRDSKRVSVSGAFFLSIEFQETGFYVIRLQRVAFGRKSDTAASRIAYLQFIRDARQVSEGVIVGQGSWQTQLETNKENYAELIVGNPEFVARFPVSLSAPGYTDALYASAGVTPTASERMDAIAAFGSGGNSGRTAALRKIADSTSLRQAEVRPAFVLMEYFGYLRRNPTDAPDNASDSGYQFWLAKLNQFNGDFVQAELVKAFISSAEYRQRFGP